jgi:hypothetical protein
MHAVMLSVAVNLELLRDGYSTATAPAMARVLRVVDNMLWQKLLQDVP